MTDAITEALGSLRAAASAERQAHAGKTRVVVQVSHSSLAVGAGEVADALLQALPKDAYLVTSGSDGASFAAPKAIVSFADGRTVEYCNLSADDVNAGMFTDTSADSDTVTNAAQPESDSSDFLAKQHRLTLQGCGEWDALHVGEYILNGGYDGLARALSMPPDDVIEEVLASGLRGRGGAYFPAGLKWRGARSVNNTPRYLVVNCEEGEPGIFKDRHIMEGVPHRLIEGAIIAAYAAGVHEAHIYINAEADLSAERMQTALEQAYASGLLGDDILSSGFALDMTIMRGAGGYVCGDETTLLNTMEGLRREPRQRPPFPTEAGLWGKPTVINNAETLSSVPYILAHGAGIVRGSRHRRRQRHEDNQP